MTKMFSDIVLPGAEPEKFLDVAEVLGYGNLVFAVRDAQSAGLVTELIEHHAAGNVSAGLAVFGSAKMQLLGAVRILQCTSADVRKIFESFRDAVIIAGCRLDQVACAAAARNNNVVCFALSDVIQGNPSNTIWNIKLCRKYSVRTAIASFAKSPLDMRAPVDIISLFTCLGMEPGMARKSLQLLADRAGKG